MLYLLIQVINMEPVVRTTPLLVMEQNTSGGNAIRIESATSQQCSKIVSKMQVRNKEYIFFLYRNFSHFVEASMWMVLRSVLQSL